MLQHTLVIGCYVEVARGDLPVQLPLGDYQQAPGHLSALSALHPHLTVEQVHPPQVHSQLTPQLLQLCHEQGQRQETHCLAEPLPGG